MSEYFREAGPVAFLITAFSIWNILKICLQSPEAVPLAPKILKTDVAVGTEQEEELAHLLDSTCEISEEGSLGYNSEERVKSPSAPPPPPHYKSNPCIWERKISPELEGVIEKIVRRAKERGDDVPLEFLLALPVSEWPNPQNNQQVIREPVALDLKTLEEPLIMGPIAPVYRPLLKVFPARPRAPRIGTPWQRPP